MLSEGVNKDRVTLQKVVEVCSYNPARVFGAYPSKGNLDVGADADVVIVDLDKKRTVSNAMLHSMCDWTPYDGRELTGWPTHTILRGQLIVEDGEPLTEIDGRGRQVRRRSSELFGITTIQLTT